MVKLYQPKVEDLWFKQALLSDEATMAYNHAWGGTLTFPEERWKTWHNHWVAQPEGKRFYRYIMENGRFLGETAYHFDEEQERFFVDVIVLASYRGKGYGKQALLLLCEAAKAQGISMLFDEIAADNPSLSLFLHCGFIEVQRTQETIVIKKELNKA